MTTAKKNQAVDAETGEVVDAPAAGGALDVAQVPRAVAEFITDMESREKATPEQVMLEVANRILNAQSVDELWQADKVVGLIDLLMIPLVIERVRFGESRYSEGLPQYAIIEGRKRDADEPFVATTGASKVVLMLYKLEKFNALPATVKVTQTYTANDGRAVLSLEPVN